MSDTPITDAVVREYNPRTARHNGDVAFDAMSKTSRKLERQFALPDFRLDAGSYSNGWNDCIRWINQNRHALPKQEALQGEQ